MDTKPVIDLKDSKEAKTFFRNQTPIAKTIALEINTQLITAFRQFQRTVVIRLSVPLEPHDPIPAIIFMDPKRMFQYRLTVQEGDCLTYTLEIRRG